MHTRIIFVLAATAAGTAVAQGARPDPSSPQAKAPPLEYRSAFEGYRPFKDEPRAPWRESNDVVKGSGEHTGHGQAPAEAKPAPQKPAAPGGHGEHK